MCVGVCVDVGVYECVCMRGGVCVCVWGGCAWMCGCALHSEGHQRRMKPHHYTEITVTGHVYSVQSPLC